MCRTLLQRYGHFVVENRRTERSPLFSAHAKAFKFERGAVLFYPPHFLSERTKTSLQVILDIISKLREKVQKEKKDAKENKVEAMVRMRLL